MNRSFVGRALVLGLLSAIGPFAIDMYLPALPAIGAALHADVAAVQWSLMAFFIAFALSQLVYGPASDIFGRKPPLYVGIALFIIGSIGCALAPDIGWLIAWRCVQGLGGGAPIVVPRAIVRDLHTGAEATRLMAMLMLVFSISPVLAPLAGSFVIEAGGWRAIFWVVTGLGLAGLAMVIGTLEETRPPAARGDSDLASTLRAFGLLLRDRRFVGLTAIGAFGMSTFFIYLANSSFVMIDHYGLTPRGFSLAFAANAIAFFAASQFAGRLAERHGLPQLIRVSAAGCAVSMAALPLLHAAGLEQLGWIVGGLLVGNAFLGLLVPTTSVLALDDHGEIAGAASALMGTLQLVLGAVVMALMGLFADGRPLPMLVGMAVMAVLTVAMAWRTLGLPWGRGRAAATAAAGR